MFRCEKCRNLSQPREGMHKVTVETRPKTYYSSRIAKSGEPQVEGVGMEIAREMKLCKLCAEPFEQQ